MGGNGENVSNGEKQTSRNLMVLKFQQPRKLSLLHQGSNPHQVLKLFLHLQGSRKVPREMHNIYQRKTIIKESGLNMMNQMLQVRRTRSSELFSSVI